MGTNSAPPLADLFLYSYASQNRRITEIKAFNLTFRYIDDVLSINNPYFAKKLDSTNIHQMTGWGGAVVINATFNNISVI